MKGKVLYDELREVFIEFKKKDYFNTFSAADLFYIFDEHENHILATFIEQFYGESYGLQCFYNRNGFNYVHDILSAKDEATVSVGDCDSIIAVFKKKEELTEEDSLFLHEMKMRKTKDNNLIVYRFEKGYRMRTAKYKELSIISLYAVFLASLIGNEYKDIMDCFNKGDCVFASLNIDKMEYSCIYRPLPYLEDNPHRSPINIPFVEEYKNHTYLNEDCYLYTSYLPVTIKETRVRPILIYFYFEKQDKMILKYILDGPKEYKNDIYGIIDDVFTSVGMPAKLIINNRDLYYILNKTLDALHIENTFVRDNVKASDALAPVITNLYQKTQDTEMESEDTVATIIDAIASVLNEIDYDADYEEEDTNNEEFVS